MTLASPRLMRKRPFISVPSFEWLQAIGSEVAAETSRSALMSVPARTVAVSRKEATLNMVKPLWNCFVEPDCRIRAFVNARGMPNGNCRYFSVHLRAARAIRDSNPADCWRKLPTPLLACGRVPAFTMEDLACHVAGVLAGDEHE